MCRMHRRKYRIIERINSADAGRGFPPKKVRVVFRFELQQVEFHWPLAQQPSNVSGSHVVRGAGLRSRRKKARRLFRAAAVCRIQR